MKIGFRARLLLAAMLPAVMAVILLLIGFLDRHTTDLDRLLHDRARATARQLGTAAEYPLFANNPEALNHLTDAVLASDQQIRGLAIIDSSKQVRASAGILSAQTWALNDQEQISDGANLTVVTPIRHSSIAVEDLYAETALPSAAAERMTALLGHAVIELSHDFINKQRRDMLLSVLAITVGVLMMAAVLSMLLAGSVTGPISHISQVVARIKLGELSARTRATNSGVLAPLAAGINDMAERIAFTEEQLRHEITLATSELWRQKEVAEKAARIDALTGVANRRAFNEVAENEVQRALRYGMPVSLILIDLDHFKEVNDNYGHQTGDAVLVSFSRTVSLVIREIDLLGRWGGEEFVVLLPGTGLSEALQAAERMRMALIDADLHFQGQRIVFTASFGVGEFNPAELTFFGLLDRVDAALYRAKTAGRNCVEAAPDILLGANKGKHDTGRRTAHGF